MRKELELLRSRQGDAPEFDDKAIDEMSRATMVFTASIFERSMKLAREAGLEEVTPEIVNQGVIVRFSRFFCCARVVVRMGMYLLHRTHT